MSDFDDDNDDPDMRRAVENSRADVGGEGADDADLQRVLLLSLAEAESANLERARIATQEEAYRLVTQERDRLARIRMEQEAEQVAELRRQAEERRRAAEENERRRVEAVAEEKRQADERQAEERRRVAEIQRQVAVDERKRKVEAAARRAAEQDEMTRAAAEIAAAEIAAAEIAVAEEDARQLAAAIAESVALAPPPHPPLLAATNSTSDRELEQALAESKKTSNASSWQTRAQEILKACGPLTPPKIRHVIEVTRGTGSSHLLSSTHSQ
jgi:membrane protein involved in colicin uptake